VEGFVVSVAEMLLALLVAVTALDAIVLAYLYLFLRMIPLIQDWPHLPQITREDQVAASDDIS